MKTRIVFVVAGIFAVGPFLVRDASANLEQQKIFKSVYSDKEKYSCQICHVAKLPKKDAHELNDYGKKASDAAGGAGKKPTAEIYKNLGDTDAAK